MDDDIIRYDRDGTPYVRITEIPDFLRPGFQKWIYHHTRPVIKDDPEPFLCAYGWDYQGYLRTLDTEEPRPRLRVIK